MANRLKAIAAALIATCLLALPALAEGPSAAERKFAIKTLNQLQALSFRYDREYCGFIGRTAQGKFATGPISQGTLDTCLPIKPDYLYEVISSFHTHGAFSTVHWSEMPSLQDVQSDSAGGTNGWISTPGGRIWYVDGRARVARQVCGIGCVLKDPNFRPNVPGPVAQRYTVSELRRHFSR
jgi:hypothetical protein